MKTKKPTISVVIPVFNAGERLQELYRVLMPAMEAISERFEVLMVDDGSGDRSWENIGRLAAADARIRGIKLGRNYGQHNALLCGVRTARYDVIVTIDDDLQHPPSEIAILLDKLAEGYDVVYGVPVQYRHEIWRTLSSKITKIVLKNAFGADTAASISAFRVFFTRLRSAFSDYRSPTVSLDVLLSWGTTRFAAVKVKHAFRLSGKSNYTLGRLITYAFNMITGFSTLPLQLASVMGIAFTLFGFGILVWVFAGYLFYGREVPGFAFLASTVAIFSGAQMFTLGIIGEYLARIFQRTLDRPAYLIAERIEAIENDRESSEEMHLPHPKGN